MNMEFLLPSQITLIIPSTFIFFLFIYYLLRKNATTTNQNAPPEAKGAWPIIGHLPLFVGRKLAYKVLGALADKHGPIFTIRLGVIRALVVSNSEIAKECFTGSNDKVFLNRPKSIATEHFSYNYATFAASPYGPHWREMRKIAMLELLSNQRLAMLSNVRESEMKILVKEVYEKWVKEGSCLMEMKRWFDDMTLKLTVRLIAGNGTAQVDEGNREAFRAFFELMGAFTVGDAIPFLRWLDLGGYEKEMKRTVKKMDDLLQEWLGEHKRRKNSGVAVEADKDFMDVMLEILNGVRGTSNALKFDVDTINKSTCLGLTLGATDTTASTLTWAIALLLNNPHVLKTAQEELDTQIGGKRLVKEADIKNLVYIQAIVKETLRLHPPTQLMPARQSIEDCTMAGYHVPAGTTLFVNLWKIHHDPKVWPEPWEFRPERFLTTHKDVDMKGKHYELLPFGSGRRVCPGISFGLQVVQFTLASFVHAFEIAKSPANDDQPVDMTESFGLTNAKAMPFEVVLTPRLPSGVYAE